MATDLYERLAQHLDNLPAGYPRTDSGKLSAGKLVGMLVKSKVDRLLASK